MFLGLLVAAPQLLAFVGRVRTSTGGASGGHYEPASCPAPDAPGAKPHEAPKPAQPAPQQWQQQQAHERYSSGAPAPTCNQGPIPTGPSDWGAPLQPSAAQPPCRAVPPPPASNQ